MQLDDHLGLNVPIIQRFPHWIWQATVICMSILKNSSLIQAWMHTTTTTTTTRSNKRKHFHVTKNNKAYTHPASFTLTAASPDLNDFDYSSILGWDRFYQNLDKDMNQVPIVEWHSSIPFSTIVDFIPTGSSCLILGCGNSPLPIAILEAHNHHNHLPKNQANQTRITCLDSSQTCLDQLKKHMEEALTYRNETAILDCVSFVCGDAIELSQTLGTNIGRFDRIIDKGLLDALLCCEGWDTSVEQLLQESSKVLRHGGQYLLISYHLPKSTETFVQKVTAPDLEWTFCLDGYSNERVQVSLATKVISSNVISDHESSF